MKKTQAVSYREMISKTSQEIVEEELDLKVQTAKSELEITIATTKRDLAVAKRKLAEAQCSYPYKVESELEAQETVLALEKGLQFAQSVLASRF